MISNLQGAAVNANPILAHLGIKKRPLEAPKGVHCKIACFIGRHQNC